MRLAGLEDVLEEREEREESSEDESEVRALFVLFLEDLEPFLTASVTFFATFLAVAVTDSFTRLEIVRFLLPWMMSLGSSASRRFPILATRIRRSGEGRYHYLK